MGRCRLASSTGCVAKIRGFAIAVEGMEGSVSDTGKYVEIWRKEPDGSWLIDQVIWNSDLPLAAPEPEPEDEVTDEA